MAGAVLLCAEIPSLLLIAEITSKLMREDISVTAWLIAQLATPI
jgi:hypothetical protein